MPTYLRFLRGVIDSGGSCRSTSAARSSSRTGCSTKIKDRIGQESFSAELKRVALEDPDTLG
jgi:HSP90 family molecular chaperone